MKRIVTVLLILISLPLHAQTEDIPIDFEGPARKDFGGFILDMGTMLNAESLVVTSPFPTLSRLAPMDDLSPYKINPDAFRVNPAIAYMGGTDITASRTGILSLLYNGVGSGMVNWQGKSYSLKNGAHINLYGEYNADGYKVHNPSAMPWQKNDFSAAFEFKSANGNFGVKLEVHGGRNGY